MIKDAAARPEASSLSRVWGGLIKNPSAMAGTLVGLVAKLVFPDPTPSALDSIVVGAALAATALTSGVVEKYSLQWFAYRFLAPYRDRWPSLPSPGQDRGRAAWHRANALPPADFDGKDAESAPSDPPALCDK